MMENYFSKYTKHHILWIIEILKIHILELNMAQKTPDDSMAIMNLRVAFETSVEQTCGNAGLIRFK